MLYSYINNSKVYTYVCMYAWRRACSEVNMYVRMCDRSRRTKECWHAHKFTFIHKHMISNRYMERGKRKHKIKHKKRQIDGYTYVVYASKMVLDHITGRITYTYNIYIQTWHHENKLISKKLIDTYTHVVYTYTYPSTNPSIYIHLKVHVHDWFLHCSWYPYLLLGQLGIPRYPYIHI